MPRPKKIRCCTCEPCVYYYKPRGVPMRDIEEVVLKEDEFEALKLHDVDELDQVNAAKKMKVSQPTFARILDSGYKKVADALVYGKAIKIENSNMI